MTIRHSCSHFLPLLCSGRLLHSSSCSPCAFQNPNERGYIMRTEYIDYGDLSHLFAVLMEANALILRVSLETGLRLGDCCALTTEQVRRQRFTVREQKTGKSRRVHLSKGLQAAILAQAGTLYAFPHRTDPQRHRTRQAVYSDLKRAARAFRIPQNVAPHTMRKLYAKTLFDQCGDMELVQRALNHDRITTTLIYALCDQIDSLPKPSRRKG